MQLDRHTIDIIVTGFPGKSICHGSLGWSTIVLLRYEQRLGLIDVGSFGQRRLLIDALEERGLRPDDITDVLLTHSHYDHSINWTLFPKARIVIDETELAWSLDEPWGRTPVPELYVRELDRWPTTERVGDGDEVFPRLRAHRMPGHTPGSLVFVLHGSEHDVIFTGDAAKNRAELLSHSADLTYDPALSRQSISAIWSLWTARKGNVLVPGHDVPMVLEDGVPTYIEGRQAGISAWYAEELETTTIISLVP